MYARMLPFPCFDLTAFHLLVIFLLNTLKTNSPVQVSCWAVFVCFGVLQYKIKVFHGSGFNLLLFNQLFVFPSG